jgi:hypothetical protein
VSELADEAAESGGSRKKPLDPHALFRPQQQVSARVLTVDAETRRISLTLKPSAVAAQLPGDKTAHNEGGSGELEVRDMDADMASSSEDLDMQDVQATDEDELGSGSDDMVEGSDGVGGEEGDEGIAVDDLDVSGEESESEDHMVGEGDSEAEEEEGEEESVSGSDEEAGAGVLWP